jgi:hypothetical protein
MQAFARGFNDRLILLRTKQEIIIREMAPISSRWRHMSNLAAASIKESQGSSASSRKMDTFLVKMPESTASWTTLWEKVR